MNSADMLDWCAEHRVMLSFGLHSVTLFCAPHPYVERATLHEAITAMRAQMAAQGTGLTTLSSGPTTTGVVPQTPLEQLIGAVGQSAKREEDSTHE